MAEVITLAKMPQGRDNKTVFTEEMKQFYIDNNATMSFPDLCKHYGISAFTMYGIIKEHKLPKKIRVFKERESKFTEFFDWRNATLIDPIFGLENFYRFNND